MIKFILPFFLHIPSILAREPGSWIKFEIKLLYTGVRRNDRSHKIYFFFNGMKIIYNITVCYDITVN